MNIELARTYRILHLEDDPADALLISHEIARSGTHCAIEVARDREEFLKALDKGPYDVILADYTLPDINGIEALQIVRDRGLSAAIIIVSGTVGEEVAVECLKRGATDYVLKSNLIRLPSAISHAFETSELKEQKLNAERAAAASRELMSTVLENVGAFIYVKDASGHYTYVNKPCLDLWSLPLDQAIGASDLDIFEKSFAEQIRRDDLRVLRDGETIRKEEAGRLKARDTLATYLAIKLPLRDANGSIIGLCGVSTDITEQRRKEIDIVRLNRALDIKSKCTRIISRARTEAELNNEICRQIVEGGRYRMAWIGYAEDGGEKQVRPAASFGDDRGYLEAANITWADIDRGHGPAGTAIRTGLPQVNRIIARDTDMTPWRTAALLRGYASATSFPLKDGKRVFGTLTMYSDEERPFTEPETLLFEELAMDLAHAISAHRLEVGNAQAQERLEKSLIEALEAIAATLEMRDPYTAGHQHRVADLAAAIAREVGMSQFEIDGIRLAALVHDIGKIRVPIDILTKPTKLTSLEFELIKTHVQAGYDILKGIDFPWPIADLVLQHHERLDGSGYPQGLRENEILPGAKIMAIADVVEAMASFRPYRPALGVDVALDEIKRGSGTLYDSAASDACLRLFRENRFALNYAH